MPKLDSKIASIKKTINELFSDTSVSPVETRNALNELSEEIDILLEALPRDEDDE